MRPELESLESAIGHRFRDREIFERAITHSSHVHEKSNAGAVAARDNEQLEFLGDSILGFLISEALVERFPAYTEGRLSNLKAHMVSAAHLYGVAESLSLGQYLQLGRGEEMSGGRSKRTLLVDALEPLIAAIYLDEGIDAARTFVRRHILGNMTADVLLSTDHLPAALTDHKSALQELARARHLPLPRYVIVKERGPEHSKTFTIEVRIGKDWIAQAEGYSKKNAAQNAARLVFEQLVAETPARES